MNYTKEQIKEIKSLKYVKNCTARHIVFNKEFKEEVVKIALKKVPSKDIFRQFWFPEYVVKSTIPANAIARWKYLHERWMVEDVKWRPRKDRK